MVIAFLAAGLAVACGVGAGLALVEYGRGWRAARAGRASCPVAVVVAGDPEGTLSPALLRSVAVSDVGNPTLLAVAHPRGDAASGAALREIGVLLDPSRVRVTAADPPPRAFSMAWHQARAADAVLDDARVVVAMDSCARPASREPAPIAGAVAARDALDAAGACPVAAPGTAGPLGVLVGRLAADLAPLLVGWYGPPGLIPVCVALRREALFPVLRDPMTLNRPGLATSVLMATPRSRAVLLPLPVGTLASGRPRSLRDVLLRHLAVLARLSPVRTSLIGMGVAALPMSLLATAWSGTSVALAALALAAVARLVFAATWTRSVQGSGPAIASLLLAPLRDLAFLAILIQAVFRRTWRSGGRLFRLRRGAILVPADKGPGTFLPDP